MTGGGAAGRESDTYIARAASAGFPSSASSCVSFCFLLFFIYLLSQSVAPPPLHCQNRVFFYFYFLLENNSAPPHLPPLGRPDVIGALSRFRGDPNNSIPNLTNDHRHKFVVTAFVVGRLAERERESCFEAAPSEWMYISYDKAKNLLKKERRVTSLG